MARKPSRRSRPGSRTTASAPATSPRWPSCPGAIIYDFGGRRFNEIYPDKRLAQAALHALRPGVFPLGAQGAGRMAMQGSYFGCDAHSGQGGDSARSAPPRSPPSRW